jgi:hypothetical protein
MRKFRGIDDKPGWEYRELADIRRQLRELRAARTLSGSDFSLVPDNRIPPSAVDLAVTAPGVIPVDAVSSASTPGYVNLTATNFAVPVAGVNLIDATVPVPIGFSSCVLSLTGRVFAANSTATTDYLYARLSVNGALSNAVPVQTPAAVSALNVAASAVVLTSLGGSFPLRLWAASSAADWAASATNTADLTGGIVWFR